MKNELLHKRLIEKTFPHLVLVEENHRYSDNQKKHIRQIHQARGFNFLYDVLQGLKNRRVFFSDCC
jgi:UDP-3-O-acyl-N-acetylglucosamine deacetylase